MASSCTRCALRLQRATEPTTRRTFTTTPTRRRGGLPTFTPTSSPELDSLLSTLRTQHFVPAALTPPERKLIFSPKSRQYLAENPQATSIGNSEDVELKWIDQRTQIPNRVKLLKRAIRLMRESEEKAAWNQLPALLAGLKKMKKPATDRQMAKMVRLASNAGRFGIVLQCLHQVHNTGMSLKNDEVLDAVGWGLRQIAARDGWSREGLEKALRDAKEVAMQLEDEEHGTGATVRPGDPRRRPEVVGVFLELAAVYAYRFQDGKDGDGKVRAYAERLLSNIQGAEGPTTTTPAERGPQHEMLRGVPIWHGLSLAQEMLDDNMPNAELASRVIDNWEAGLRTLAQNLEADETKTKTGSYGDQALTAWRDCIRD
ncbi:hypothetical protein LTR37_020896 [Vermiconidia calcicola]|uniref:Uncharacterized protein n=1 Tax=Vermiconidia calcicola TaxID=1690605 RepID=A0ACC3MBF8_9PEZI|nr:hypothetical protein LTR37_020896 [Vermiconidia calcicola]